MRCAAATLAVLLAGGAAAADSVPTRARTLADRGRAAHDQRDYAGAIAAFTEAYALAPAPALLFNLAQAYRLAGRCDDAALMYRRFLASAPADDARALAEVHLASVDRCAHTQELRVTTTPAIAKLPPAPSSPPIAEHRTSRAGIGVAIGGGVALLVAGYYALDAHQTAAEVERRYERGDKWKQLASLDASGQRSATIAEIAAATGVVAAAVGATILVVDHKRHRGKRRLDVSPGGHGARVSFAWQF